MSYFKVNTIDFILDSYLEGLELKSFIKNQMEFINLNKIFICKFNALDEKSKNVLFKNSNCTNCGLCDLKYCSLNNKWKNLNSNYNFDLLLKSLPHISILIKYLYPNLSVATQVKTIGNSRDKRLDLITLNNSNLYIFKVITNTSKIDFYYRAYTNILNYISDKYPEYETDFYFLVSQNIIDSSDEIIKYPWLTIEQIYGRRLKNGNFIK